ncbi:protein disulfide oxidoreductase [Zobellella endophytica]|uniref:Protein disulfide oxidoreductase n=1 Tax=Zobellella endophytica TaxID=2116700 RepID=A0A2P7R3P2_9GAMM|nr:protein disulfide oxidoreductase [Zobellella endophytica]PSJ44827.1 protein disulfide oxidoreductase [Zobellella endophytica]
MRCPWRRPARGLAYLLLLAAVVGAVDLWRGRALPTEAVALGSLTTLEGKTLDLVALSRERPVLVYIWASWCGACRFVSPMVDLVGEPVVSIAIASGSDDRVAGYMAQHGHDFAVVNDEHNILARRLGIQATPTLLVASQGELKYATTGFTTLPGMYLRLWLAKIRSWGLGYYIV